MDAAYRALVIEVNLRALLRILAGLTSMLPVRGVVTRRVHLLVLDILRPAEAATRRLIFIASSGMVAVPGRRKSAPTGAIPKGDGTRERVPAFGLFDPRRRVGPLPEQRRARGYGPQVVMIGVDGRVADARPVVSPDGIVDAKRVRARLGALGRALEDVPGQARRLVRVLASGRSKFTRPMRPGRPPGYRARGRRPVDEVLAECHAFALMTPDVRGPPAG